MTCCPMPARRSAAADGSWSGKGSGPRRTSRSTPSCPSSCSTASTTSSSIRPPGRPPDSSPPRPGRRRSAALASRGSRRSPTFKGCAATIRASWRPRSAPNDRDAPEGPGRRSDERRRHGSKGGDDLAGASHHEGAFPAFWPSGRGGPRSLLSTCEETPISRRLSCSDRAEPNPQIPRRASNRGGGRRPPRGGGGGGAGGGGARAPSRGGTPRQRRGQLSRQTQDFRKWRRTEAAIAQGGNQSTNHLRDDGTIRARGDRPLMRAEAVVQDDDVTRPHASE